MKPAHPPFNLNDPDVRVGVFLRNGEEYLGGLPYSPTVSDGVVMFWHEGELRGIPLDLVKKVTFYSIKP